MNLDDLHSHPDVGARDQQPQPEVPGQVPNPVRDPMPGRPVDPVIPPIHDPGTPGRPERPEPPPEPRP